MHVCTILASCDVSVMCTIVLYMSESCINSKSFLKGENKYLNVKVFGFLKNHVIKNLNIQTQLQLKQRF